MTKPLILSIALLLSSSALLQAQTLICGICYTYNAAGERTQRKTCCWDPNQDEENPPPGGGGSSSLTSGIDSTGLGDSLIIYSRQAGMSLSEPGDAWTSTLFPNPTKGAFAINFSKEIVSVELTVLDASGRIIGSAKAKNTWFIEYDVTPVTPGTYIVNLIADNQRKQFKLIKQE